MEKLFLVLKDLTKHVLGGPTLNKVCVPFCLTNKKSQHYNSTMVAKRALNFGTPRSKRARKSVSSMLLYRPLTPEVKFNDLPIVYNSASAATFFINSINQGTAVFNRVGAKVKVYKVEYVIAQASGDPVRVDLLLNNVAGSSPAHTFDTSINRRLFSILSTKYLHSGASLNSRGALVTYNLPYPVIAKFGDALGSTINAGQIAARITTPSATTVTGYFRVFYTDV